MEKDEREKEKKGICLGCPKRPDCFQLCPEAGFFVNQGQVKGKELVTNVIYQENEWPDGFSVNTKLTEKQADVIALLLQGFKKIQVVKKLAISGVAFDKRMREIKIKIKRKLDPDYEAPGSHVD